MNHPLIPVQKAAPPTTKASTLLQIRQQAEIEAKQLGFSALGVADVNLDSAAPRLQQWLAQGFHGQMDYMARHGLLRARPAQLLPGTVRVLSLRLPYWPVAADAASQLADPARAYIARYALGRDYHKLMRRRLQRLAEKIDQLCAHQFRAFVDSAPVLEVELAHRARLGWRGKHTLLLTRQGSGFFLGEIFTSLPLPLDDVRTEDEHCGSCTRCIDCCPTGAIVAPYVLDARRCIAYLTIEYDGVIAPELRPLIGNRIFGCDDCQLVCPWNRFAQTSAEAGFAPRHGLDQIRLAELACWSEEQFRERMRGSAIARIGFERWQRNLAVALGNAPDNSETRRALAHLAANASPLVQMHLPDKIAV